MSPDEIALESDIEYIQKQVGEDPSANRIHSFNINLPVFTLNPNKKVKSRLISLTAK